MSTSSAVDLDARIALLEQRDERLTQLLDLLAQRTAAPAKPGKDWDAYAAVIASFIGILALAVAGYTAYVQRQQLRAQVWPHLQLTYSSVNLRIWAENEGTGPARITAMRVTVDGAAVRNWDDVQKAASFTDDTVLRRSSFSHAVVPAGREHDIIVTNDSDDGRAKFRDLLPYGKHPISIFVCYCSVLGDCWATGHGDTHLDDTGSGECPIRDAERFEE
jgi:hypothetical protein